MKEGKRFEVAKSDDGQNVKLAIKGTKSEAQHIEVMPPGAAIAMGKQLVEVAKSIVPKEQKRSTS